MVKIIKKKKKRKEGKEGKDKVLQGTFFFNRIPSYKYV